MGHSRSLSACAQSWNDETFVNESALVFDPSLWALNLLSFKSLIDAQNIAISPCGRFVERKIDNVRKTPSRPSAKTFVEDGPLSRRLRAPFQRRLLVTKAWK